MSILTRKDFLIGAAVGFFVGPFLASKAKMLLDKAKGAAA